jgi:hypothetical protein
MRLHRYSWLAVWLWLAAALAAPAPDLVLDADEPSRPGGDLFTNGPIPTIQIVISKDSLESLRRDPRRDVPAVVTEGGKTFREVAVHCKGAAGSFRGVDDKPGMMLNFNKMTPGQKFHGLKKIMLNNSVQDPTFLNEKICGYLFRTAGVPSPRTGHALVELNGRKFGLYVIKEDFNDDFLSRHFKNPDGNMYDIKPGRDITEEMTLDFGNGPKNRADLKAAAAACQEPDPAQRWQRLQRTVDMERFLSLMALETLTAHWDGYCAGRNNFRIYAEAKTGRLVFFPNDLDQMFSDPGRNLYDPGANGLVAQTVMRTPAARSAYYEQAESIATNVFRLADLTNRLHQTAVRVRAALASWNAGAARDFDNQHRTVLQRLIAREASLKAQMAEFRKRRAKFENGAFKPERWGPLFEGGADLSRQKDPESLYIRAGHGGAPAWRSRTVVGPGKYRLEGRVKTQAVLALKAELGAGAGLRITGKPARQNQLSGSSDWQKLTYEFDVTVDGEEVEMVCELRATKGEVWFDLASLQLVKLK